MKKADKIQWNQPGKKKWFLLVCGSAGFTVATISIATEMTIVEAVFFAIGIGSLAGSLARFCIAHIRPED